MKFTENNGSRLFGRQSTVCRLTGPRIEGAVSWSFRTFTASETGFFLGRINRTIQCSAGSGGNMIPQIANRK
ncbi:hypothetical protein PC41400_20870 [Paenibacillus chitinolyticus]|uniref:Uncharacterized protein n=1 Tax=Paenibacillus chitinolyticus TaxID=79263 RepID=A0A410X074_9BACL|nr:hypothetical protein PC41400_20870 [Paenibacillus chitinolyticus]